MAVEPCPVCGGPYDPVARLAAYLEREAAFCAAYPRLHCPACGKRLSPGSDNVDAAGALGVTEHVQIHCHHCGHCFDVPRSPLASRSDER